MTLAPKRITKSIVIKPDDIALVAIEGNMKVGDTSKRLEVYLDSAIRVMVSEDQTQTLTNKTISSASNTITIDADTATVSNLEVDNLKVGVLDIDLTAVSATDDTLASAKAIKTYVDDSIATVDQASEISYSNGTSGLTATDVQAAIDEVEGRTDTTETDISNLETLSGVAGATNLGTFTGTTISDSSDEKSALQELETAVETKSDSSTVTEIDVNVNDLITLSGVAENASDLGTFTGTTITDSSTNKVALQELETSVETKLASTHSSDTTTHGTTGDIVGTSDTQTFTNKIFDDALTVQEIATPSTPAAGYKKIYPKTDGTLVTLDDSGNEVEVGSGAGDASTIHLTEAEKLSAIGDVDLTGNNADFDGGGVITASSLTLSTTAADLIKGTKVVKYDPNADGSNDYFGFTKTIPKGLRGRDLGFSFEFKNDSTTIDNDFRFCVKQKDGSSIGDIEYFDMETFNNTNGNSSIFSTSSFIAGDCTSIEYGWQNTSTTTTVELYVDNILVSSDPFIYKELVSKPYAFKAANSTAVSIGATSETDIILGNDDGTNGGSFDDDNVYDTSTGYVTIPETGKYSFSFLGLLGNAINEAYTLRIKRVGDSLILGRSTEVGTSGETVRVSAIASLVKGDQVKVTTESTSDASYTYQASASFFTGFKVVETDDHVITPAKSTFSNWESFTPTGSWSTNTTYTGVKKQIGDEEHYKIKVSLAGAPTSATLTIDIPDSGIIDITKVEADTDNTTLGQTSLLDNGTGDFAGRVRYDTTTTVQIDYLDTSASPTAVTQAAPFTFASGDSIYIEFSVPLEGQSSEASFLAAVPVARSMVRLATGNGHGSTNTVIRRFSVEIDNIGRGILYLDDAADGATFTIQEAGVYAIDFNDERNTGTARAGISLNSTELTTTIRTIIQAHRVRLAENTTTEIALCSATIILNVGDVIRAHGDGNCTGATRTGFTITQLVRH